VTTRGLLLLLVFLVAVLVLIEMYTHGYLRF
jgi:hypothetical protein